MTSFDSGTCSLAVVCKWIRQNRKFSQHRMWTAQCLLVDISGDMVQVIRVDSTHTYLGRNLPCNSSPTKNVDFAHRVQVLWANFTNCRWRKVMSKNSELLTGVCCVLLLVGCEVRIRWPNVILQTNRKSCNKRPSTIEELENRLCWSRF